MHGLLQIKLNKLYLIINSLINKLNTHYLIFPYPEHIPNSTVSTPDQHRTFPALSHQYSGVTVCP